MVRLNKQHPAAEIKLKGKEGVFTIAVDAQMLGAQRTDLGSPFDMTRPVGIRERLNLLWLAYDYDSGFKYLVDRVIHYGSNGFTFFTKKSERKFWNEWSKRVNEGLPTIIPGLGEVIKWNLKHLLLGGFSFNNWLWGTMTIGKRTYQVPLKWDLYNQRSVMITRKSTFSSENVGIKVEKDWLTQGNTGWAEGYDLVRKEDMKMNEDIIVPKDKTSYFLLKFNTSQGDNTSDDLKPQEAHTSQSLYPTPPFFSLIPVLKQRQQLRAMDLNIVDGFINKLVHWKIGDKDNPPVPDKYDKSGVLVETGTINKVKAVITKENKGNVLQLFTPYWVELDIKTPDINPLLKTEKYMQPWIEMLWSFGLIVDPEGSGNQFTDINTQNFEQLVEFYRVEHIERMLENVIFREIAKRNDLEVPEIRFNPLNTVNNDFLRNIRELSGMGKTSTDTLLKFHKLDKRFELPLITEEIDKGEEGQFENMSEQDIFNANTPIKFKQAVDSGGEEKIKVSSTGPGRPKNKKDSKERKKEE